MASLVEELIAVLDEEYEAYDNLRKISLEKTGVIVSNNLSRLQEITTEEQKVLDVLVNLDKKRDTCIADMASVMNKKASHMTVSHIIQLMEGQPEYQQTLAKQRERLLEVVENLRQVSVHNQDLLEDAIEMTEFDINLLRSMDQAPETANYDRGTYSGGTLGASTSKFDTKQ